MKTIVAVLLLSSFQSKSQTITKYYDTDWKETANVKAVYYAKFTKEGSTYICNSYWVKTNTLRGKSTYTDTSMSRPIGMQVLYFKNGNSADSSIFDNNGKLKSNYQFYQNKKLALHIEVAEGGKQSLVEAYDEDGKKIKDYIFEKEASFKGGENKWQSYLQKNASHNIYTKNKTDTAVSVHVEFIVDENGNVIKPKVIKSSGVKSVDSDALRIIGSSPEWTNAIQFNKPVKAYRIQAITYSLKPEIK